MKGFALCQELYLTFVLTSSEGSQYDSNIIRRWGKHKLENLDYFAKVTKHHR